VVLVMVVLEVGNEGYVQDADDGGFGCVASCCGRRWDFGRCHGEGLKCEIWRIAVDVLGIGKIQGYSIVYVLCNECGK